VKSQKNDLKLELDFNSESAKLIGEDAGSSKVLDEVWLNSQIDQRLSKSQGSFDKAQKAHTSGKLESARRYMQVSLEFGAKAYWWSENSSRQKELHSYIHDIAEWNHDNLGCYIEFENGKYVQRCMIVYSHKRIGISPGLYGDKICSLCDGDLSICPHKSSRTYWVRGDEKNTNGECRICLNKECKHDPKHIYRARVIASMKNPVLEEVSFVKYPVQPEMRVANEFSYTPDEIAQVVGRKLRAHEKLMCHACSGECPGFAELETPA